MEVAVLGYGTVGSGVFEVLERNHDVIAKKAGEDINVKYVLDLREFPGDPVESKLVHSYDVILNDPEVKIIAEVMGGLNAAYAFTKQALEAGKSVCTSNKELVARYGTELMQIAKEHDCNYLFEASCGGGIPIIRPLMTSLTGDVIEEITGILNGTTNYILTNMIQKGSDFDTVLKEAQAMGYAELHPEADVEGHDACRKIAILSSIAYGQLIDYQDVYTEGITKIDEMDIRYANEMGMTIKLLGSSKKAGDDVFAMVAPHLLVNQEDPLFHVNGVFNGIFVRGNMLGDSMFYGSGAGKLPTASAVVGDVVDLARNIGRDVTPRWNPEKMVLKSIQEEEKRFFVRVKGTVEESYEEVKALFGEVSPIVLKGVDSEFAFLSNVMKERELKAAMETSEKFISSLRVRG